MVEGDKAIHRIRIQRVEVEFEKPDDAFKTRDLLSEVCRNRLIPAMEKLFEEKYAAAPLISIPYLLIDAGQVNAENWENELVRSVIRRLEQYLDRKGAGVRRKKEVSGAAESGDSGDPGGLERKRRASFILYYLRNGVQPWNSPYGSKEQLREELWRLWTSRAAFDIKELPATRDLHDDFFGELRELLAANLNAAKRLLYLLPETNLHQAFFKKGWGRNELTKARKKWRMASGLAGLPEGEFDPVFLQVLSRLHSMQEPASRVFPEVFSREVARVLEQSYTPVFMKLPGNLRDHRKEAFNLPSAEATLSQRVEAPVYIANAGLVLLHPFLHYLFENAGHTVKNTWDSTELQQRSIVLSQYLVTGKDDYTEHDLFFNKLLAGFPVEAPLQLDITLSDFEKNEARELLESVITHWKALKNTSIPALRETFLQRPGKIAPRDKGWLLEVDQRMPDVLLGKIPWGFSTIKTRWMKEILNVEWA